MSVPSACGMCFRSASKLREHGRVHTESEPIYLNAKTVASHSNEMTEMIFRLHKRIHTKENLHQCDKCGKPFTNSGSLKVHKRTHTNKSSFEKTGLVTIY